MPYKIEINHSLGIIESKVDGLLTKQDVLESFGILKKLMQEGYRCLLVDSKNLELSPSEFGDFVEILSQFSEIDWNIRCARLLDQNKDYTATFLLWETYDTAPGVTIKFFYEKDQAISWLTQVE